MKRLRNLLELDLEILERVRCFPILFGIPESVRA